MCIRNQLTMLLMFIVLAATPMVAGQSFEPLGFLTSRDPSLQYTRIEAVSGDGETVVGSSLTDGGTYQGFLWRGGQAHQLPRPEGFHTEVLAQDVNYDGSRIVGSGAQFIGSTRAIIWTSSGNHYQPTTATQWTECTTTAATTDTSFGLLYASPTFQLWMIDGGKVQLDLFRSTAMGSITVNACSGDGTWVVGTMSELGEADVAGFVVNVPLDHDPVARYVVDPGQLSHKHTRITDISDNGDVVVGFTYDDMRAAQSFVLRYDSNNGWVFEERLYPGMALAVSGDGKWMVTQDGLGGMRLESIEPSSPSVSVDLIAWLHEHGFAVDWQVLAPRDLSYDGSVIVGMGNDRRGTTQGWRIKLRE